VEEHRERTGSEVAERVLGDWDGLKGSWVKVFPRDYKRVLAERGEHHYGSIGEMQIAADGSTPLESGTGVEGVPAHG
jgi:hypothetical protein